MNKKDVLGLRLLPGITGKMESTPPLVQCRNCSKYDTHTMIGKAWFWRCCCYLIKYQQAKTIVKEF